MKRSMTYHKKMAVVPLLLGTLLIGGLLFAPVTFAKMLTEVEIVMTDKDFQVVKGGVGPRKEMDLVSGMPTEITLRNEDSVAHEFMSTLFARTPVQVAGEATVISTQRARGFRIDPGKTVKLSFVPPEDPDSDTMYDVFWCNIHGKHHGEAMRGEILTVATTTGTGAF